MNELSSKQKQQFRAKLLQVRENFTGTDGQFAKIYGISKTAFSRIKSGEIDRVISDMSWYVIADKLNIADDDENWNIARTQVFTKVEQAVAMCREQGIGLLFCDECEIGKTTTAKYLSTTQKNTFYVDCSQTKTVSVFIHTLAQTLGLEATGKLEHIKSAIKTSIKIMSRQHKLVIILDEFGDLSYPVFLIVKELYNATEGKVGLLAMGADALAEKIRKGISHKKVGFKELKSRFGGKVLRAVPIGQEREAFYRDEVRMALEVNGCPKNKLNETVNKCLVKDDDGGFYAMRRAKVFIKKMRERGEIV